MSSDRKTEVEAQLDNIPKGLEISQRLILVALTACTQGQDRPVSEPHAELATLAGLSLSDYFTGLLKLKFAGFVMDDGQGLRIDHIAIRAAKDVDDDRLSKTVRRDVAGRQGRQGQPKREPWACCYRSKSMSHGSRSRMTMR